MGEAPFHGEFASGRHMEKEILKNFYSIAGPQAGNTSNGQKIPVHRQVRTRETREKEISHSYEADSRP